MFSSFPKRSIFLVGTALLLAILLVVRWISDWGLVTIHAKDIPLGKVIDSIVRQGHIRVVSSLDPERKVSIDVDKVTPVQSLEVISQLTDASWRVTYVAAQTKSDLNITLDALRGSDHIDGWTNAFYPGMPLFTESGEALDPRRLSLTLEGSGQDLPSLLDQAAQKSGVMALFPKDWTPAIPKLPKRERVSHVIPSLIKGVHGQVAEIFYLSEHSRHTGEDRTDGEQGSSFWEKTNRAWRDQREAARIALLPAAEQATAKQRMAQRKSLMDSMQGLTPEERRAKWREAMSNPDTLQQMQDRQQLRQQNQTPEQRINRAVNYLNRKAAAQSKSVH